MRGVALECVVDLDLKSLQWPPRRLVVRVEVDPTVRIVLGEDVDLELEVPENTAIDFTCVEKVCTPTLGHDRTINNLESGGLSVLSFQPEKVEPSQRSTHTSVAETGGVASKTARATTDRTLLITEPL